MNIGGHTGTTQQRPSSANAGKTIVLAIHANVIHKILSQ